MEIERKLMNKNDLIIAINNLYDENIDLKEQVEYQDQWRKEYLEIIQKAIEYIKECTSSPDEYERFISTGECKKLLDILKGEE